MASGYNVYRGIGDLSNVDFDTPVDTLAVGDTTPSLVGIGHLPNTRYLYVIRPVLDDLESPDYTAIVEFVTDGDTEWIGKRPEPVEFVAVAALSGAQIKVSWTWRTPPGDDAPEDFGVYNSTTAPITLGTPDATVAYTRDGAYSHTFSLANGVSYYFTVTARTAAPLESRAANTAGPVMADSDAPSTPVALVTSKF